CDYLIIVAASRIQFAGTTRHLLQMYQQFIVSDEALATLRKTHTVLPVRSSEHMHTVVIRTASPLEGPWTRQPVSLEAIILAYLAQAAATETTSVSQGGKEMVQ
ncbi:MAG TPA: hypothetical protein VKB35_17315, partial [Ktedonobacteraceae bacterium]|nr:hypothetical protein [Ktedonobacteraceae bacterium]